MDLRPAYRALVASPADLARCRNADGIAPMLQLLRQLWHCGSLDDNALIGALEQANAETLDLPPDALAGQWLPSAYRASDRSLQWCLPLGPPTRPFLEDYLGDCRQRDPVNALIRPRTAMAPLLAAAPRQGPCAAGFIFHLSRCGSTLVSGALSELDRSCVLSESPLLTAVLLDAGLTDAEKRALLPQLVQLQGAAFPGRNAVIVKWNAWDLACWPLILQACPDVPRVCLFREPAEILASHAVSAGRHMAGDPSMRSLAPMFAPPAADEDLLSLRIRVLQGLMAAMAALSAQEGGTTLDYAQLNADAILALAPRFGLSADAAGQVCLRARLQRHSKQPEARFVPDAARKREHFAADERQRIDRALAPWHRALQAHASATSPTHAPA
ncbi:hypothetical protein [Arenimonas sp. MALMAid1274]|uniref:hypothetical protein n=1 Tax=Arenimonas sp. MALMAid1274 TaxID=3411630 RepID=UPI003B9FCEE7